MNEFPIDIPGSDTRQNMAKFDKNFANHADKICQLYNK